MIHLPSDLKYSKFIYNMAPNFWFIHNIYIMILLSIYCYSSSPTFLWPRNINESCFLLFSRKYYSSFCNVDRVKLRETIIGVFLSFKLSPIGNTSGACTIIKHAFIIDSFRSKLVCLSK